MDAKKYIIGFLTNMCNKFSGISFKYQYEKSSQLHIIEVQPLEMYEENDEYSCIEVDFSMDFDEKHYPESVLFVSDKSIIKVDKVDLYIDKNCIIDYLSNSVVTSFSSEKETTSPCNMEKAEEPYLLTDENHYVLAA